MAEGRPVTVIISPWPIRPCRARNPLPDLFSKHALRNVRRLSGKPRWETGSVSIPNCVAWIGPDAFVGCSRLTNVTIPGSVTNIGSDAFQSIGSFASVYFGGNAPSIEGGIFSGTGTTTVYRLPGKTGFAQDNMIWNPLIQTGDGSFGVQNHQFGFNVTGTINLTVVVEACTNLANPVWIPLTTNTLAKGTFYFSDPEWRNYPARFYGLGFP